MKFKLNYPIHFQGKRHEKGSIVEMTKKQAEAHGPGVCEEPTKEELKALEQEKQEDQKNEQEEK